MVKTLELAMERAAALPEAAQERLALDMLDYLARLSELRTEIDAGIRELDSGLGRPLDIEEVIRNARARHAEQA
jgi:hypothetical protein